MQSGGKFVILLSNDLPVALANKTVLAPAIQRHQKKKND